MSKSHTPHTPLTPTARAAKLHTWPRLAALLALFSTPAWLPQAQAGTADLANVPLSTAVSFSKPNIMFVLDDSKSMGWDWMPDDVGQTRTTPWKPYDTYGYRSSQCNGVAYNPAVVYNPPVDKNGVAYPNATYSAAWLDGFDTTAGTQNLATITGHYETTVRYYYTYTGSQPTMSWAYSPANGDVISSTFYGECMSAPMTSPGSLVFTKVDSAGLSAAQQTNFANWFSYYRIRYLTMRTAVGQAFANLDSNFRVGFTTINDASVSGAGFLDVKDFDATQRDQFFNLLYTSTLSPNGTPLRAALSKVGRYYAKRVSGQTYDPMTNSAIDPTLNSCRRNYTLLSTDGMWNGPGGVKLDGATPIGNEDSSEPSPLRDTIGVANTLADVAEYYYANDLRPDIPNGNMRVAAGSRDTATWQHMSTFTLGLGVKGVLSFDKNYLTQTSGDYINLTTGAASWPIPTYITAGIETATHVDDLWHAAINGRGQYFSAQNPLDVTQGLSTAFNLISAENGTSTAAASSSLKPVSGGDDLVFVPRFSSATWSGDLRAYHYTYDPVTREITGVNTADGQELWSAKTKLDAQVTRNVYFNNAGTLAPLTYANLSAALKYSVDNRCAAAPLLLQCSSMTAAAKAKVTGPNIISFITGTRSLEMSAANIDNRVFRARDSRLGDFVNASPVYVAAPPFRYADGGYGSFVVANANRPRVVYAASNDGMLHAFATGTTATQHTPDASGGTELWAFTPTAVMSDLWRLADNAFDNDHRFFVDATPVTGDIYDSGASKWRSLLVGGLGKGGRSYYALDITDPTNPKVLWEISSTTSGFSNLGLSFGSPIITKLKNGTWAVIVSSGTNNVSPGDGMGHVYVLNASTGALISDLSTGTGSTTTPSNLNQLNGWVDSDTNNTALRLYGGDMLGNLWRFDHDDRLAPSGNEATLIGTATTPTGAVQPITTQPALVELKINGILTPVVTVGTGRYLGTSDLTDSTVQSIYVMKDTLGAIAPLVGNFRSVAANMVKQTMTPTHQINNPVIVDWATKNGWYVDLDQSTRERINLDPTAISGSTVSYVSTIPDGSVCPVGGSSYVYDFNLQGGTFSKTASYPKMVVGISRFLANSTNSLQRKIATLTTLDDQTADVVKRAATPPTISDTVKRSTWRELVD